MSVKNQSGVSNTSRNTPSDTSIPVREPHYGTPITVRDYSFLGAGQDAVILLKRESWRENYFLNRSQLPLKNDVIPNPLGLFQQHLLNYLPRPTRYHPLTRQEREFMSEVVKLENASQRSGSSVSSGSFGLSGSSRKPFCPLCFSVYQKTAEDEKKPGPVRGTPGPWSDHSLRDNGKVTCPKLASLSCQQCGHTGLESHVEALCPRGRKQ